MRGKRRVFPSSLIPRAVLSLGLAVGGPTAPAAQQPSAQPDRARVEIQRTLRGFYFNLARRDWDALTADILPAKVIAHRPPPDAIVLAPGYPGALTPAADVLERCPAGVTALVTRATITLAGDWAEVSVPRCSTGPRMKDAFRLFRFEDRWRIVYIEMVEEGASPPQ